MSAMYLDFGPSEKEIVGSDLDLDELNSYLEEVAHDRENDEEEYSEWITRLGESVFRPSKEEDNF